MSHDSSKIPNEAVVVRGGVPTSQKLHDGCSEHEGVYGFSVQAEASVTVGDLARAGKVPHKSVGVTTAGELRELGFDVVRTSGKGFHATVVVKEDAHVEDLEGLAKAFEVQPNPAERAK